MGVAESTKGQARGLLMAIGRRPVVEQKARWTGLPWSCPLQCEEIVVCPNVMEPSCQLYISRL